MQARVARPRPRRTMRCRCRWLTILVLFLFAAVCLWIRSIVWVLHFDKQDEHVAPALIHPPAISSTMPKGNDWAYAFLIADYHPHRRHTLSMFYHVLVATHSVRHRQSSVADVVVMVQIAADSPIRRLATTQQDRLEALGIKVVYLDDSTRHKASFYELVMAKFAVLSLTHYQRVVFLDTDVLPLCNLDYLFSAVPQSSVLLHAMYKDPVNAGLFVVTPDMDAYDQLRSIVRDGNWWEHAPLDRYRLWNGQLDSGWDFYCGHSDQGLLLYWSRFVHGNVSIVVGSEIEEYRGGRLVSTVSSREIFGQSSCLSERSPKWASNIDTPMSSSMNVSSLLFYRDFHHAVGLAKFWRMPIPRWLASWQEQIVEESVPLGSQRDRCQSTNEYWWYLLVEANYTYHLQLEPLRSIPSLLEERPTSLQGDLFTVLNRTSHGQPLNNRRTP